MADETTAAATQSDYEYKLGYSGEEVDSVCEKVMSLNTAESINQATKKALALKDAATINSAVTKVSKLIFGQASIKVSGKTIGTASATVDLSAYSKPICVACVQGNGSAAVGGLSVFIKSSSEIWFYIQSSTELTAATAQYVNYVIGEAT